MKYDAFISYSTADKLTADATVNYLESNGLRCWYAPRDIQAGMPWPMAISQALKSSHVMVLLFSEASNISKQVAREITLADNCPDLVIIPFRLSAVDPSEQMDYYLANTHWLDAVSLEDNAAYADLRETIRAITARAITAVHGENHPKPIDAEESISPLPPSDDLKITKFRMDVRQALEDGILDSAELKILDKVRQLSEIDEETANKIIEDEKRQLQVDMSGEPDEGTFRNQIRAYVAKGEFTDCMQAEVEDIQANCNLDDADAKRIIEEERASSLEAKYRVEVREILEAGPTPDIAKSFLGLLQTKLGISQATADRIYQEESEGVVTSSKDQSCETDGPAAGGEYLSSVDLAKALTETFSGELCDQLRAALGIDHKNGSISSQMVDQLLFSIGYLRRSNNETSWRCTELGRTFCREVVEDREGHERVYQHWNALITEDIEHAVRSHIEKEGATAPVDDELESILASFTPVRQNFMRALVRSGHADEPVITQDQILAIVANDPELEFPDWLVNPKLSPEYASENNGQFLNPLQVYKDTMEDAGDDSSESIVSDDESNDETADIDDESLLSRSGQFSRIQMRFINALKANGYAGKETITREEITELADRTPGLNFPHWATKKAYKTDKRGVFRNPMYPVFTNTQMRFVDTLKANDLYSVPTLTRPVMQELVEKTAGLNFPYWATHKPYLTGKRGHFHNPLIPLELDAYPEGS